MCHVKFKDSVNNSCTPLLSTAQRDKWLDACSIKDNHQIISINQALPLHLSTAAHSAQS